jgi:hypothetical protein
MNHVVDNVNYISSIYNNYQDIFGSWKDITVSVMATVGVFAFLSKIWSILFNKKERMDNNKINNEKIRELWNITFKNHSTLEAVTSLIGSLSKKIDYFEKFADNIDQKIIDKLKSCSEINETSVENITNEIDNINTNNTEKFNKIQRNFNILSLKLGDFTYDEYRKIISGINEQIREMKGAIFLPDEDNDEDN